MSDITDEQVLTAYRAFCEKRLGHTLSDRDFQAVVSPVEVTWVRAALEAAEDVRANAEDGTIPRHTFSYIESDPDEDECGDCGRPMGDDEFHYQDDEMGFQR